MKKSSRFYSSLSLLIILNVIIKPIWIFGIDRQVQNTVGTALYGSYFALLNFSIVFSFLLDWGITNFFNRQLAASPESFINKAGPLFFIKLLFALAYAIIVFAAAYLSGITNWNILFLIITIQALTSLFIFLRSIITAQQWFTTDAWVSVLDKALMILLCGSFLYFPAATGYITIERFLLIQLICTAIAIITVLVILFKKGTVFSTKKIALPGKQLWRAALPFAIIVLLMSVHYRLDGFLLERIHPNGSYEAGIYAGAYRLLDAANMIGYLLASFLLPFIARHWGQGNKVDKVILNSRHLLFVFSIPVVATTIFLAPWLQQMLYHNTDANAITVLQWCLPALVCYSLVQVYGTVMTASGHIIPFCYISLAAVILNVLLNLLLIPAWGAKGCCMAALGSQAFCGISALLYVRKRSGINIHFRSWLIYIFIAAIVSGFYYICRNAGIDQWVLIIAAGFITFSLAVILKLVDLKNWRNIIQRNTPKK